MPEPSRFPALIAAGLCMAMMGAAGSGRAQSPALALKPAPALPSGPTRLSELAARALEVQPVIRGAEARERADDERLEQARGALRLNVVGALGYRREFANSGFTVPYSSSYSAVQFALPLYRPQSDAGVVQAQSQRETSRFARFETQRDVLSKLAETFLAAAQADAEAGLLEQERALLLQQRTLNERRMAGGVGTSVEVMETAARADSLLAQVQGAQGSYLMQLADIGRLAGVPVVGVERVREAEPPYVVPGNVAAALALARERSASLARLNATVALARATAEFQRAGVSPTIDLVGNYDLGRSLVSGVPQSLPSTSLGVQLAVPLWTGGIAGARVREALALAEKAEADLKDAEWVLEAELRKAYFDLERNQKQWRTQAGALEIAMQAYTATRKAFEAGVRSNIDLLNSQQLTFSARREALRARVAILLAQVRILALSETLNVEFLARLDPAFGD